MLFFNSNKLIELKHFNLNNIRFKDLNKLNSFLLQGYNVLNITTEMDSLIFSLYKPLFFINTGKIFSNYKLSFNNHYSNSCGPFIAGRINNSKLEPVPGKSNLDPLTVEYSKFILNSRKNIKELPINSIIKVNLNV